jgi:hypothetical protein
VHGLTTDRRRAAQRPAAGRSNLYQIRRVYPAHRGDPTRTGPARRSLRQLATGDAATDPHRHAAGRAAAVDDFGIHRVVRRHADPPYPAVEQLPRRRPDRRPRQTTPGFEALWQAHTTDQQLALF